jgi:hypothetical protein
VKHIPHILYANCNNNLQLQTRFTLQTFFVEAKTAFWQFLRFICLSRSLFFALRLIVIFTFPKKRFSVFPQPSIQSISRIFSNCLFPFIFLKFSFAQSWFLLAWLFLLPTSLFIFCFLFRLSSSHIFFSSLFFSSNLTYFSVPIIPQTFSLIFSQISYFIFQRNLIP